MKTLLLTAAICLGCQLAHSYQDVGNNTLQTNGSASDVQAAVTASNEGGTVLIPAGTFSWTQTVNVSKGIQLKGAGAGGLIACSQTSVPIGTGSKSFTIAKQGYLSFSVGQTVQIISVVNKSNMMTGKVSSFTANNVIVDVTSVTGSGTWRAWTFAEPSTTTVSNSTGGVSLRLENSSKQNYILLSGVHFATGTTSSPGDNVRHLIIGPNGVAGKTVNIFDCRFSGNIDHTRIQAVNGLIYRCSFDCGFNSGGGSGYGNDTEALQFKADSQTYSWSSNPTIGTGDADGKNNFYVEDCYFAGMALKSIDYDDNSRTVVRYNVFDNSGFLAHGPDSSAHGARHFEIYNNTFVYSPEGVSPEFKLTYNINWWFWMRGGSGVITDNVTPAISGTQWWGTRASFRMMVENLRRPGGPYSCWKTYPSPHQVGQGYSNGAAVRDPLYIWNNTGAQTAVVADYEPDQCGNGVSSTTFIVSGRDYFVGSPKPSYVKYSYPHPMRSGATPAPGPPTITAQPQAQNVPSGQAVSFYVTASGTEPLTYQWQKNQSNIGGATASTYSIASVQSGDAGNYRCVVSNGNGSVISTEVLLSVMAAQNPPSITAQPQAITRTVGQSASFTVSATGTAPLGYQWQKNQADISGATSATLSFASVQTSDSASYRCIVTNGAGTATSSGVSLTVNASVAPTSRYVDETAGNDSNVGTSAAPWKRCPGMVGWSGSATLQPGDVVYFDRSDIWTIGRNSGGAGLDLKAGVHYIGDEWDPERAGTGKAILRAGDRHEAGVVRFWEDHATYPTWLEGFEVDANMQRANLIDINHSFWKVGLTKGIKRVEDCVCHGNTANGSEGDYKYGIIISDHSPDASGTVSNVEILNTLVYNTPRDGICLYPGEAGMISNILVRGCEVYGTGTDPSYAEGHGILLKGNVKNSTVEYSYAHDVDSSAAFINGPESGNGTGPTGCTIRYCILQTADNNGVIRFYGTGTKSCDIYGNIVLDNEAAGGLSINGCSGQLTLNVYNNTFYNSYVDLANSSATASVGIRNNIFYELDDTPLNDPGRKISDHANNLYYRKNGGTLVTIGSTNYTSGNLGSWESTALSSDPLFLNTADPPNGFSVVAGSLLPNRAGLSLKNGSPALNSGGALAATFNGAINSVQRPVDAGWDRGAYEGGAAGTAPLPPKNIRKK